jgi:uncharacterized delta-60 repeat protein
VTLVLAKPGGADRTFSRDGVATLRNDTRLIGAAVQPDGKLVAAGVAGESANRAKLLVARFKTNGGLDRTFSGNGLFEGAVGTAGADVVILRNGDIVVAGSTTDPTGQLPLGMLALRLNRNGSLDRSFSGNGVANAFDGTGQNGQGLAVALSGSKVVVAGSSRPGPGGDGFARTAVARFNANGSPDGGFGTGGAAFLDFGRLSFANDVVVQGNGRIVIAGSQRANLQNTAVLAARLTAGGAPDPSFGGNAGVPGLFVQQFAVNAGFSAAYGVAIVGGKIVLGGSAYTDTDGVDALAVRLTGGGALDRSFSGDGAAYFPAAVNRNQFTTQDPVPGAQGIAVSAGTILLGGYFDENTLKNPAVWAVRSNGSLRSSFGARGRGQISVEDGAGLNDIAAARIRVSRRVTKPVIYGAGAAGGDIFNPAKGLAARFQGL